MRMINLSMKTLTRGQNIYVEYFFDSFDSEAGHLVTLKSF